MSVSELHFLAHPVNVRKSRRGSSDATAAAAAANSSSSSNAGAVGFVNKGWNLLQDVFTTEQAKVAATGARKSRSARQAGKLVFRTHIQAWSDQCAPHLGKGGGLPIG